MLASLSLVRRVRRAINPKRRQPVGDGRPAVQVTVRADGWNGIKVDAEPGNRQMQFELDDPSARVECKSGTLKVILPDAATFSRVVVSSLLSGQVDAIELRLIRVPDWLAAATRSPRLARETTEFSWRRNGYVLDLRVAWRKPQDMHVALSQVLGVVLRTQLWDQTVGPVFSIGRSDWLERRSTWPQAVVTAKPLDDQRDEQGRALGPYVAAPPSENTLSPIISGVANPYGRVLKGAADEYTLSGEPDRLILRNAQGEVVLLLDKSRSPEAAILASGISKYAVARADGPVPINPFTSHALRLLAACGMVFSSHEPMAQERLGALGLVVVDKTQAVDDVGGYALAVEASRTMAIHGDAALRRTSLAGQGALPLPTVSAVISSKRPADVASCLAYLGAQTYPSLEVVVGTHGYHLDEETQANLAGLLRCPVRIEFIPAELTLGEGLGRLARIADGELITKVDDDDHYGPEHVTDLVLAWHQTRADIVAKGARFVYLPDLGKTIDRAWAAPEVFNVTPAGGTLLIARSTLQQVGGWSTSSRHVDADLIARVRNLGGLIFRTHALEYVYVRRSMGHTWSTQLERLLEQSERTYDDLPTGILRPTHTLHDRTPSMATRPLGASPFVG